MAINSDALLNLAFPAIDHFISPRDCMLYALGLGLAADDPSNGSHLRFVYEKELKCFPTMPVIMGHPGKWQENPKFGITRTQVVHGEQGLRLHRPIPVGETLTAFNKITDVVDKGYGRGALVFLERDLIDKNSGDRVATITTTVFARADGGFGGPPGPKSRLEPMPSDPADVVLEYTIPLNAALIYRLSGDYNPLHADPDAARSAGFSRPILHGLCTFGIAARAILEAFCDYDANALVSINTRFSTPVYPGEKLQFEMWRFGQSVLFRARVQMRDAMVLNFGRAEIKELLRDQH